MRTIAIGNQKGGVAKTTTARETGAMLAEAGARVLMVDLDGQHDLTNLLLGRKPGACVSEVLAGRVEPSDAIEKTGRERLHLIGATDAACNLDGAIDGDFGNVGRMLGAVADRYDFAILDFPRAASKATISALVSADNVVIPTEAARSGVNAAESMLAFVEQVRGMFNPGLSVAGVLLTRYNPRAAISKEYAAILDQNCKAHGTALFNATIPQGVAVQEADGAAKTLGEYRPGSKPAQAYKAYMIELLARLSR